MQSLDKDLLSYVYYRNNVPLFNIITC